jgi:hypothetical protein
MSDTDEKRIRKTFVREVAAPTLLEAYTKLDEMNRSFYDMYPIHIAELEEPEGYIRVTIFGWENDTSRDYLCV